MYDIKWIREHPDAFDRGLKRRGLEPQSQWLLGLDEQRRKAILAVEAAQASRRTISDEIAAAKRANDDQKAAALMSEGIQLRESIGFLENDEKQVSELLQDELAEIPNLPTDDVPDGNSEFDNIENKRVGLARNFEFAPKQHFELGEALGMMNFEVAAKLSGARFVVLNSGLARLERALGQYMLDLHTSEHGYLEVNPPLLVRNNVMFGTAQLPKFVEDQFLATALPES
ncbi:MAG: serine--tRNA ligase, partial [Pseudolabrys sp.]